MTDRDFEIGNKKFKLSKMNAMKQFHIMRKMGPILSKMVPIAVEVSKSSDKDQYKTITAIMDGISSLSDADSEAVLFGLLSSVEIQQLPLGNWARVSTETRLLFEDLELPLLMQLAGRAFGYNMKGFLEGLPLALKAQG